MSEVVHYRGTLKPIEKLEGETLEQQCKRLAGNAKLPSYYDNYEEFISDHEVGFMIIQNGIVYEVEQIEVDANDDMFNATLKENGVIEYEVRYYNGGCGFDEAIEEAFKNIKK